jgi:hypothetical protein
MHREPLFFREVQPAVALPASGTGALSTKRLPFIVKTSIFRFRKNDNLALQKLCA